MNSVENFFRWHPTGLMNKKIEKSITESDSLLLATWNFNSLKFIVFCVFGLFFTTFIGFSQSKVALQILLESMDASSSGRGNTGTAIANDINASFYNPAGLGFLKNTIIPKNAFINNNEDVVTNYFEDNYGVSYYPYLTDNYKLLTARKVGVHLKPLSGTVVLDYVVANYGELTRISENGQAFGQFKTLEYYLGLSYGSEISENLSIGGKVKYYVSYVDPMISPSTNQDYAGSGILFDFGMMWKPEISSDTSYFFGRKFLSLGFNIQNFGPKVEYFRESEAPPSAFRFGVAINPNISKDHNFLLAIDATKILVKRDSLGTDPFPTQLISGWENPSDISLGIGLEYWFKNSFALRTGYYSESPDMGNRNFLTLGTSFKYAILQADLSYYHSSSTARYLTNILKFNFKVGG